MMRQIGYGAACAALVLFATTAAEAKQQVRIDSRIAGSGLFTPDPATGGGQSDSLFYGKGAPGKSSLSTEAIYGPPGP